MDAPMTPQRLEDRGGEGDRAEQAVSEDEAEALGDLGAEVGVLSPSLPLFPVPCSLSLSLSPSDRVRTSGRRNARSGTARTVR